MGPGMKKILLGSAALFFMGASLPAFATDMPMKAPVYKAAATPFSWNGFYFGGHAGYGWGDYTFVDNEIGAGTSKLKPAGWLGGLQLGYNSQFAPNWMLGYEADFSWSDLHDSGAMTAGQPTRTKVDYLGTGRTRLGYVIDRTMLYATGGLAWAHTKSTESAGALSQSFDEYHAGWTLGGGVEYAFAPRWSLKVEYLYADLGKNRIVEAAGERSEALKLNMVRAGINYRFGEPSARPMSMPVKAYAAGPDWSGSYLGVHGGYGWSDLDLTTVGLSANPKPRGAFGGVQTGYNWLFAPNWFFGLESDTSFALLKNTDTISVVAFKGKIDNFETIRARYGYVAGPALWYVTGGLAAASVRTVDAIAGIGDVDPLKHFHVGWTGGFGYEYMFAPMWSAKVEYLYADLGKSTEHISPVTTDLTMNTVKVGINYHGPVLERLFGGR
jgi:outer membrane immunogenic protein